MDYTVFIVPILYLLVLPFGVAAHNIGLGVCLGILFIGYLVDYKTNAKKIKTLLPCANKARLQQFLILWMVWMIPITMSTLAHGRTKDAVGFFFGYIMGGLIPVVSVLFAVLHRTRQDLNAQSKLIFPPRSLELYEKILVVVVCFLGVLSVSQIIWPWKFESGVFSAAIPRARGFYSHPLTLAYIALIFVPWSGARLLQPSISFRKRMNYAMAAIATLVTVACSQSVTVIVVTFLIYLWLGVQTLSKRQIAGFLVLSIFAGGLTVGTDNFLSDKFKTVLSGKRGDHETNYPDDRMAFWHAHWEMFKDAPLKGHGNGLQAVDRAPYYERIGLGHIERMYEAHNMYLQTAVEGGLISLLALVALLGWLSWLAASLKQIPRWQRLFLVVTPLSFAISGLTQNAIQSAAVRFVFLGYIGVLLYLAERQSKISLVGPRDESWWTGCPPRYGKCAGVEENDTISALNQITLDSSRQDVLDYFNNTWTLTEVLFSALQGEEAFFRTPAHGLRHPLIFYYGHPAVLYVNKLRLAGLQNGPINSQFESLLESGVDEMSWDDLSKNDKEWPSIDEVHRYRRQVYQMVSNVINDHPDLGKGPGHITMSHPLWALFMAFEHERIHLETSAVLIRELPSPLVRKPSQWPQDSASQGPLLSDSPWIFVPPNSVKIGKSESIPTFGWDNEYGERIVALKNPTRMRQHLISNREYLEFVKDGGYQNQDWWSSEGWRWRQFRNAKWPSFWVSTGPSGLHQYAIRSTFEVVPMKDDWPVIVNFHEATAYAKWLTRRDLAAEPDVCYRLCSEAEFHNAREWFSAGSQNPTLRFGSESSVRGNNRSDQVQELTGNVWQWLLDQFNPLPGFKIHPYYEDFSMPCFDGRHQMMAGGSFLSTGDEASSFARFHFRPHFLQNAGIRLVKSQNNDDGCAVRILEHTINKPVQLNPYETDQILSEYLLLHYGDATDQMPYEFGPSGVTLFPQRCAEFLINAAKQTQKPLRRVLDLGCAVGGSTFTLAQAASDCAVGLDFSERFIATAIDLKEKGVVRYLITEEGALQNWREASVKNAMARTRAQFIRGDACCLPDDIGLFDGVLLANLLCRVPDPSRVIGALIGGPGHVNSGRGLLNPGGILVMTTPFSWLTTYTPNDKWIGGFEKQGHPQWSSQELIKRLSPSFKLIDKGHCPVVIREHRRKFQYIVPDLFVFEKI